MMIYWTIIISKWANGTFLQIVAKSVKSESGNPCKVSSLRYAFYAFKQFNFVITQETFALAKTYWRRLEGFLKMSSGQHIFVFQDVLKASSRRLQDIIARRLLEDVLQTPLEDVLKKSWRRLEDVLQRQLEDIFKTSWRHYWKTYCKHKTKICYFEDVFKTSWRSLGKQERNFCCKAAKWRFNKIPARPYVTFIR